MLALQWVEVHIFSEDRRDRKATVNRTKRISVHTSLYIPSQAETMRPCIVDLYSGGCGTWTRWECEPCSFVFTWLYLSLNSPHIQHQTLALTRSLCLRARWWLSSAPCQDKITPDNLRPFPIPPVGMAHGSRKNARFFYWGTGNCPGSLIVPLQKTAEWRTVNIMSGSVTSSCASVLSASVCVCFPLSKSKKGLHFFSALSRW